MSKLHKQSHIIVLHASCTKKLQAVTRSGYLVAVPLGLGNATTDEVIAHSGNAVPPAQPLNILTVRSFRFIKRHWLIIARKAFTFLNSEIYQRD